MAGCQIAGHADTYGLGIRIAFYLQWFGMIIASWLLEPDALSLKFLSGLTVAATSVGLALDVAALQPAEVYVTLLLACGTLYFLVPVFLWRLLCCCRPWWDAGRWRRVRVGWLFKAGTGLMFGALLGLQIWFWGAGVYTRPAGTDVGCQQYGFLFGQVQLDSPGVTAVNIIIHLAILLVGSVKFAEWIGMFEECRWYRRRKRRRWSITQDRIESLQQLRTISDVIVATVLTMAVELVISWNNISGVNDLGTVAQLIPPVASGAFLLRSVFAWLSEPSPEQSHFFEFPYFPGGSFYTSTTGGSNGGGGGGGQSRRNTVYIGSSRDWDGQRRHSHHHHNRRRHHAREDSQVVDPSYVPYNAMGYMSSAYPQMSAAGVAQEPAPAATAHSRHATVVDEVEEIYAADDGGTAQPAPAVHHR